MTIYKVFPEDPDLAPQSFTSRAEAQDWADGLCCSYTIERIKLW